MEPPLPVIILLEVTTKPTLIFLLTAPPVEEQTHVDCVEPTHAKGHGEVCKVIDSSDVILHILDVRDPIGTMRESVLEYIKKGKAHKQVALIINSWGPRP